MGTETGTPWFTDSDYVSTQARKRPKPGDQQARTTQARRPPKLGDDPSPEITWTG